MTWLLLVLVALLLVILFAAPTWFKQRQLKTLLGAVDGGRITTAWIYSASSLEGQVDGRAARIETVGINRGMLVLSVEQGSSVRAEAVRRTRLRDLIEGIGTDILIRLKSSHQPACSKEIKDLMGRILVEYPELGRVTASEGRLAVFRADYLSQHLEPDRARRLLEDLCGTARCLEMASAVTNSWTERINSILVPLLDTHEGLRRGLVGCSEEDVATIERKSGHTLPAAFVALLGRFGRSRGSLMKGADFSFPEILQYREVADSLLSDLEDLELDERDFVFWMEQGYQFFFFRAGESDDPAVFLYEDDTAAFKKVSDSLTEWLRICIQEEIHLREGRAR